MFGQERIFSQKRILITGHCGFKGSWLSTWLTSLGAKVSGLSLEIPTNPSMFEATCLHENVDDIRADICAHETVFKTLTRVQPDFVFHLAAQPLVKLSYEHTINTWSSNLMGTVSLLEALRHYANSCIAVFITSDKCYDNSEWIWGYRETDVLGGPDPYSASKGAAELAIKSYVKSFFPANGPIRIGIGRAGNVIGGGDWAADRIVPDCIRAWSQGQVAELRSPQATRPWQHVLEPLSGYLNLAYYLYESANLHGEPFNFGPNLDQNYTVADVVSTMSDQWPGTKWKDVSMKTDGPYESGLLKLNCDKALAFLNWRATMNFEETLKMTISWYRSYYETPHQNMREVTLNQIEEYTTMARRRNQIWAQ